MENVWLAFASCLIIGAIILAVRSAYRNGVRDGYGFAKEPWDRDYDHVLEILLTFEEPLATIEKKRRADCKKAGVAETFLGMPVFPGSGCDCPPASGQSSDQQPVKHCVYRCPVCRRVLAEGANWDQPIGEMECLNCGCVLVPEEEVIEGA